MCLSIFFSDIRISGKTALRNLKGPLMIVANHPDSFLDGISIAAQCASPAYFLARGDVFRKKPLYKKLLSLLHVIPVHRLSEGKDHLHENEETFNACKEILRNNGIVIIFIEGICVLSHELQPFKKGTARIVQGSWDEGVPTKVLPVGLYYETLRGIGKSLQIITGPVLSKEDFRTETVLPRQLKAFNDLLYTQIDDLIKSRKGVKTYKNPLLINITRLLHAPLYYPISRFIHQKTIGTVFYDSVLFGALVLLYPIYLLIVFALLLYLKFPVLGSMAIVGVFPLTAYFSRKAVYGSKP